MQKALIYNIFINDHFETENLRFTCVFDSSKIEIPKNIDVVTHYVEIKRGGSLKKSIFFDENDTCLKDVSLLLSVFQGTHIFTKKENIGRISTHRKCDFKFLLSYEISDFLDVSFANLSKLPKERIEVIKTALLMYYEIKYLIFYGDLKGILLLNCFEYLIGAIYRQDENYYENDLKMQCAYSHIVGMFNYQNFIDDKLSKKVRPKRLSEFKLENNIKSVASFSEQYQQMRNWLAHGKQHKKPEFLDLPSNSEFTFYYKTENYIRIILADLVYGKDYVRRFDVLYQLILEQNVCITPTPDFTKLRFYDSSEYLLKKKEDEK